MPDAQVYMSNDPRHRLLEAKLLGLVDASCPLRMWTDLAAPLGRGLSSNVFASADGMVSEPRHMRCCVRTECDGCARPSHSRALMRRT